MKKAYIEPVMIVEDFTVSEMVAADCALPVAELKFVQQMGTGWNCDTGYESKYWVDGVVNGKHNGKGTAYAFFCDLYEGTKDLDDKAGNDFAFTSDYASVSAGNICEYDPVEAGKTFGYGYECNDDTSAIQKS